MMNNNKSVKQYKQKIKWLWNSRVNQVKTGEVGYITDEGVEYTNTIEGENNE